MLSFVAAVKWNIDGARSKCEIKNHSKACEERKTGDPAEGLTVGFEQINLTFQVLGGGCRKGAWTPTILQSQTPSPARSTTLNYIGRLPL